MNRNVTVDFPEKACENMSTVSFAHMYLSVYQIEQ